MLNIPSETLMYCAQCSTILKFNWYMFDSERSGNFCVDCFRHNQAIKENKPIWVIDIKKDKQMKEYKEVSFFDLKGGEEVEVVLKGYVHNLSMPNNLRTDAKFELIQHNHHTSNKSTIHLNQTIKSIKVAQPKATPLEIGECFDNQCSSTGYSKVIHIDNFKRRFIVVHGDGSYGDYNQNSQIFKDKRTSGIPIDWDATFA